MTLPVGNLRPFVTSDNLTSSTRPAGFDQATSIKTLKIRSVALIALGAVSFVFGSLILWGILRPLAGVMAALVVIGMGAGITYLARHRLGFDSKAMAVDGAGSPGAACVLDFYTLSCLERETSEHQILLKKRDWRI